MKILKAITLLAAVAGLSACGGGYDPATRNLPIEAPLAAAPAPSYSVAALQVSVPESLRVSEANVFYPIADIVWRGDPYGNRYEQVASMFVDGMTRGVRDLTGELQVVAEVQIQRFHSLTQRTRYTFGGVHSIRFELVVRDAETGAVIDGPRIVNADLEAYGGSRAVAAETQGQTQRVRITAHLAEVIREELARSVAQPVATPG